jgi:hypothetical protein
MMTLKSEIITAQQFYEMAEMAVNAIVTDESRYDAESLKNMLTLALTKAREEWVTVNAGATIPYQWFCTEELMLDCGEQWDEYEQEKSCVLRFSMPNFINIKGAQQISITYPNGEPYNYIAQTYAQFAGWVKDRYFELEDLIYIHDGILHLRASAKIRDDDRLLVTGIPFDPESLKSYNPMHDSYPATPDIMSYAIDKVFKPMLYANQKKVDMASNSSD